MATIQGRRSRREQASARSATAAISVAAELDEKHESAAGRAAGVEASVQEEKHLDADDARSNVMLCRRAIRPHCMLR